MITEHNLKRIGKGSRRLGSAKAWMVAPVILSIIIPVALLDLCFTVYQAVCFPVFSIPRVRRSSFLNFNRGGMEALYRVDRLYCHYCTYVNGVLAYAAKIAAETERMWCPVRHLLERENPVLGHRGDFVGADSPVELEEYFKGFEGDGERQGRARDRR